MLRSYFFVLFAMFEILVSHGSTATEPACSKFSYEEKLLEKMIRTEIKVETIHNEIKKTEENVLNTLTVIKKTASDLFEKFDDLRNNLTGGIATRMKEMQNGEEYFASKFEELKSNVSENMEKEMDILAKLKEKKLQSTVAFHAHKLKDLILDQKLEVLVFQSIITNEGSGYDSSTGIFTTPVAGVYHFSVHVCAAYQKYSTIGMVLDGTFIAKSINYDNDAYACGSVDAVVKMASGERVWVTTTAPSTLYVLSGENIHSMNTFSGVLIST